MVVAQDTHTQDNLRELKGSLSALALAIAVLLVLLHPYRGLTHDARLYVVQALASLHPELYANDIFLRLGSQSDYSIFAPIFAFVMRWLEVEHAAAALTLASQMLFLIAATTVARTFLPWRLSLLAVLMLTALPDHYGPARIFSYLEGFATPRMLAESFVLFAIAATARQMRATAAILVGMAMLIHPIMALPGAVMLTMFSLPSQVWRSWRTYAAVILLLVASAPVMWLLSLETMDSAWLQIVGARAGYISVTAWTADEWGRVAAVVAALWIASVVLDGDARRLSRAMIASTLALLLFSAIGGDWLHIKLIVQVQPWRVLWLSTVVAFFLLPAIAYRCWQTSALHRAALLLLASALLAAMQSLALMIAPLAALAVCCGRKTLAPPTTRLVVVGSALVLVVTAVHACAINVLLLTSDVPGVEISPLVDWLRTTSSGGFLPIGLLLLLSWLHGRISRFLQPLLIGLLGVSLLAVGGASASSWTEVLYDEQMKQSFAPWRERVPAGTDVLWDTQTVLGDDAVVAAWLLLERPSYISHMQLATGLFSREAAFELRRRYLSTEHFSRGLHALCHSTGVRFVATPIAFKDAAPVVASPQVDHPLRSFKLYACP